MNREYGEYRYRSSLIRDRVEGYVGCELVRIQEGHQIPIARVLFWDACGQFFVETLGSDVPLEILEELISEAKASIKIG